MTENEIRLISLIRDSEEPQRTLQLAIDTILLLLEQPESSQSPVVACPPVSDQTDLTTSVLPR